MSEVQDDNPFVVPPELLEADECPEDEVNGLVEGQKLFYTNAMRDGTSKENALGAYYNPSLNGGGDDDKLAPDESVKARRNLLYSSGDAGESRIEGHDRLSDEAKHLAELLTPALEAYGRKKTDIERFAAWAGDRKNETQVVKDALAAALNAYNQAVYHVKNKNPELLPADIAAIDSCRVPSTQEICDSKASQPGVINEWDEPANTHPGVPSVPKANPVSDSSKTVVPGALSVEPVATPTIVEGFEPIIQAPAEAVKPVTPAPSFLRKFKFGRAPSAKKPDAYDDFLSSKAAEAEAARAPVAPKSTPANSVVAPSAAPSFLRKFGPGLGLAAAGLFVVGAIPTVYSLASTGRPAPIVDSSPAPTPAPAATPKVAAPSEQSSPTSTAESTPTLAPKVAPTVPGSTTEGTVVYNKVSAAFSSSAESDLKTAVATNSLVGDLYAGQKDWHQVKAMHPWSPSKAALTDLEGKLDTWGGYDEVLRVMGTCAPDTIDQALTCVANNLSSKTAFEIAGQITAISGDKVINPDQAGVAQVQADLANGLADKVVQIETTKIEDLKPKPFHPHTSSATSGASSDAGLGASYDAPEPMGLKQASLKEALAQEAASVPQTAPRYEDRFDIVEPGHFASNDFVVPTVGNAFDTVEPQYVKPVAKSVWGDALADQFFAKGDTVTAAPKTPVAAPKVQEAPKATSWTDRFSNVAKSVTSSVADVRSKVSSWFGR